MTSAIRHKFHVLDLLRGVAALLIVVRHTTPYWRPITFPQSYLAVDFFFCLSGFVIAYSYENRLAEGLRTRSFVLIRLIRLYPLFFIGTLLGVAAVLFANSGIPMGTSPGRFIAAAIASFAMIPAPPVSWSDIVTPFNGPAWSLFFEMVANIGLALMWKLRIASTRVLAIVTIICLVVLAAALLHSPRALDIGFTYRSLPFGIVRVGFTFFLGVLLYRRFSHQRPRPIDGGLGVAITILVAAATALTLALAPSAGIRRAYDLFAIVIVVPSVVWFGARIAVGSVLARVSAALGILSYAIYILHEPVGRLLMLGLAPYYDVAAHAPEAGLVLLVVLTTLCFALDRFYDRPVRRLLTQKWVAQGRPNA